MGCEDFGDVLFASNCVEDEELSGALCYSMASAPSSMRRRRASGAGLPSPPPKGRANAARVSRGSEVDTWGGLSLKQPQRNAAEHITVTCVIYNTVAGGVPSEEDVAAAVDDMESLYAQCRWEGKLADAGAEFMKAELTVADANKIGSKVAAQPYKPPVVGVAGFDDFPVDEEDEDDDDGRAARLVGFLPSHASDAEAVHKNVICDVSGMHPIVGVRFKKKGQDYDLCQCEFQKLSPEEQAVYEAIETPGGMPIDAALWSATAAPPAE